MTTYHRRAFRHAIALPCQVVRERDFHLVAESAVDLSTDGMLVPTDLRVLTGEELIVSFRPPRSRRWVDAQAIVARVVHGRRPGERGRRLGLAFVGLDTEARQLLFRQLRTEPPSSRGSGSGRRAHARRADCA
jgi:hypothetical protein